MDEQVKEKKRGLFSVDRWFSKIEDIVTGTGAIICSLVIFWIVVAVFSRSFFNYPLQGVYEFIALLMIPIVFLPLSYTQRFKGHIRVDFLISRLRGRAYTVMEIVMTLLALIAFFIVTTQIIKHAISLWQVGESESGAFYVPIWPFYIPAALGGILLIVRFFIDTVQSIQKLFKA